MKTLFNIVKWLSLVVAILIIGFYSFVQLKWDHAWDAPYPEITSSRDSSMIARGKYLAYGPAHCGTCHVPMDKIMEVENGNLLPLTGGWELSIPPGIFRAPNITPDMETGIGKLTDKEIARTLRHSVGSDGRCLIPLMPFQELSDYDLTAVLSFLRSQEGVSHEVKRSEFTFIGKALMACGLIKPEGPKNPPVKDMKIDSTAEYGSYLAHSVSNCVGCHTKRDLKTGAFIGVPFAGGMQFAPDAFSKGLAFVSPNLTPDTETGIMATWDEQTFIKRFKANRLHKGSPMPWGAFSRINDLEVKAIYRFLKSLDPVNHKIEQIVYSQGESLPE
ncbi:MAG: cytochrome C [Saprospiraceae bacterium]|nr:cytochrome C [Saprospiraceae bacterium]